MSSAVEIKVHAVKVTKMWGGTKTSSLCGRVRTLADGMNLTDEWRDVTCKFCLKRKPRRDAAPSDRNSPGGER